jgi:hypothetical protein
VNLAQAYVTADNEPAITGAGWDQETVPVLHSHVRYD